MAAIKADDVVSGARALFLSSTQEYTL